MAEKKTETKPEAPTEAAAGPKRKKINDLSPVEIEARLAACQEKQGGLASKYALQLLARKKALGR